MLGSLLTQWTIRLALACLAVYLGARLWNVSDRTYPGRTGSGSAASRKTRATDRKFTALRWIWTVGCVLFVAHVICAFQFTHHWSHTRAWDHTAAETQRMMGFSFGDGIYFSYLFLLLWVIDVILSWCNVQRPWWLLGLTYLFLFFIAVNGAIVFEEGPTRPVGLVVVAGLAAVLAIVIWKRASGWANSRMDVSDSHAEAEA